MKCSLVSWASHFLYTFPKKTALKFFFVYDENNLVLYWQQQARPFEEFMAFKKIFMEVFRKNVNKKCVAQPIKEHFIFSKDKLPSNMELV